MEKKWILTALLLALLTVNLLSSVSALTARIGNSRMILRGELNEVFEKSILVQNVNDVLVTIELTPNGDLADSVKLEEESFILNPGEEKKAYFTIKAEKGGTTETKISVRFVPEEGNSVGLSSTIIIITDSDVKQNNEENKNIIENSPENQGVNVIFGRSSSQDADNNEDSNISPAIILSLSTIVLIAIFAALLFYHTKLNAKKRVKKRNV